jgi:hypothetical protein
MDLTVCCATGRGGFHATRVSIRVIRDHSREFAPKAREGEWRWRWVAGSPVSVEMLGRGFAGSIKAATA